MEQYFNYNNKLKGRNIYFKQYSQTSSWTKTNYDIGPDHVIEAITKVVDPRGATTRDVVSWIRANYARKAPFIVVKVKRALNHAIREKKIELNAGRYKIIKSKSNKTVDSENNKLMNTRTNSIQRASTCISETNTNSLQDFMNCQKINSPLHLSLSRKRLVKFRQLQRPRTSHVAIQCVLPNRDSMKNKDFINHDFDWDSSTVSEETNLIK